MKTSVALVALIVASSFSAGCGRCDPLVWAMDFTFTNAAGQTTPSCSAAGVATFRIFVNGHAQLDPRQDLPCAEYEAGAEIPAESNRDEIQVEAYDANGTLLYFSRNVATSNGCGFTRYHASLAPQAGTLTFALGGFSQCPTSSFVWYSLTDVTDPAQPIVYRVDGRSSDADKTSLPCSAPTLGALPFGQYRLDFIQIVHPSSIGPGAQFVSDFENCTPQAIAHAGDDTVPVTLAPATGACAP